MSTNAEWIESKAKETKSHNFVKTVLKLAGYKVMEFGIENHIHEIIKLLTTNYKSETNRRLLSMPDFVVIDDDTKESWLVEVKYRTFKEYFDINKSNIIFKYGRMKDYLDFWKEATLILTLNVEPYCLCVDLAKVNWNVHLRDKIANDRGKFDELWKFYNIYSPIEKKFPKVTQNNIETARDITGIKTD